MAEKKHFWGLAVFLPLLVLVFALADGDPRGLLVVAALWFGCIIEYRGAKRVFSIVAFALLGSGLLVYYYPSITRDLNYTKQVYQDSSKAQREGVPYVRPPAPGSTAAPAASPAPSHAAPSSGGGITPFINDRNFSHITAGLLIVAFVVVLLVVLFWRNVNEYRDTGEWNAFTQSALVVVLVVGVWLWVGYFGDHGAFVAWPVVVLFVVALLVIPRVFALARRKIDYAEKQKEFPEPPDTGGPSHKGDFKDWL